MTTFPSSNPLELKQKESIELKWESCPGVQINPKFIVERLPFPSNAFYFTHDFWINERTLIFESPLDFITIGPYLLANRVHLFKLEFKVDHNDNNKDLIITKLTKDPVRSLYSVLSKDKKYVYTQDEKTITRFCVNDFAQCKRITLDVPDHLMLNQLMIHPDGSKLLFELNLNFYKPGSEKKTPNDSSINYIETSVFDDPKITESSRHEMNNQVHPHLLHKVPYPYCLHHILCNPINPNQISFCKTMYEVYPRIKETNERLWVLDTNKSSSPRLLYHQKKNKISKGFEIITHESWCSNGEYLTFISRRNRIKRVFIKDNSSEVIVEGHKSKGPHPWHCDGSDPTWITFDTMNKNTGLWIKNLVTGEMLNISKTLTTKNCQNYHPHPFFSPRKDYVFFNSDFDGEGRLYRVKTNI